MSVGTAFHPRTAPLNRKMQWREWSGYYASSVYADAHDIEYNAVREAAALFDVSPLYKYRVTGPDAPRLVDRVITRDATKLKVGGVFYTPWCDEHGKVIDDGTVHRLGETEYRWTAADPQYRWLTMNARGLDVHVEDESEALAARRAPGAVLAGRPRGRDRRILRRPPLLPAAGIARSPASTSMSRGPATPATSATRSGSRPSRRSRPGTRSSRPAATTASGRPGCSPSMSSASRPGSSSSRSTTRPPATRSTRSRTTRPCGDRPGPPRRPRQGGLRRQARAGARGREGRTGAPARRDGLDWYGIEGLYSAQDLPPAISPNVDRSAVPVYPPRGNQVGKLTSHGWSPILKQAIGLASVPPAYEAPGSKLQVEWTVEGRRGRVDATVVPLPFLDLPRKRA